MLKTETLEECKNLQQKARNEEEELIVAVKEGNRFLHFSVYHGSIHYFAKFRRVVVTADLFNDTLDCRCSKRKRHCVHTSVCLWYLRQHDLMDTFRGTEVIEPVVSSAATHCQETYPLPK